MPYKDNAKQLAAQRRYYAENKEKSRVRNRSNNRDRRNKNRRLIDETKEVPCMDCGIQYPSYVMDFDHRPDEVKLFNVGMSTMRTLDALLEEIAKCDIVCSNCHRHRTWIRLRETSSAVD